MKWPPKVRQYFEVKIVQAAERACCLWIAGGKSFSFALILCFLILVAQNSCGKGLGVNKWDVLELVMI